MSRGMSSPASAGCDCRTSAPATIGKLYRDLLDAGGRNGRPLSPSTVEHVHRTLSKAFGDAVEIEGVLPTNPVVKAKRPRVRSAEPGQLWTTAELRTFLGVAGQHRWARTTS